MPNNKPGRARKWLLVFSITFNILFILGLLFYWSGSPTYRLGVLTQDVNAGFLSGDSTLYKIPKGITVRDVSPRGLAAIGQFENNRFEVILTTDRDELINCNI